MIYSSASIIALATQCAPNVAPQTVAAIVIAESHGDPFALNINGAAQPPPQYSASKAAATALRFIASGYSVDLGLGQINSRNIRKLGLTWRSVFEPCTNIAALGRILTANYEASLNGRPPQVALRIALSLYNTGSREQGFRNGYVRKVAGNAGVVDVGIDATATTTAAAEDLASSNLSTKSGGDRKDASKFLDLFERAAFARRSTRQSKADAGTSVWRD